ncbi:hypothetical protein ACFVW1_41820 [Streptomyces olivochromogenes]|uniref:hypothetical protein n=1 Tax=Streptomyces olivochromogenes TaxID=1963 RepID=UPI0036D7FB74
MPCGVDSLLSDLPRKNCWTYGSAVAPHACAQGTEFSVSAEVDVGEPDVEGQMLAAAFAHHHGQALVDVAAIAQLLDLPVSAAAWVQPSIHR